MHISNEVSNTCINIYVSKYIYICYTWINICVSNDVPNTWINMYASNDVSNTWIKFVSNTWINMYIYKNKSLIYV